MSKPYLKQVNIQSTPALSKEGEVYTVEKKMQVVVEDDSKFYLMWNHIVALLMGVNSLADIKVMGWILSNLNYNDNTISLNKFYKKKVMESIDAGKSTVEKSITNLVEKGFIVRDEECKRCAMYHVNPSYVWYGDSKARDKKLKGVLELIQYQNLPDMERERIDDMKRYEEWYQNQSKK